MNIESRRGIETKRERERVSKKVTKKHSLVKGVVEPEEEEYV